MALLELIRPQPDWYAALEVAFTRPPGVPERRAGEDPWDSKPNGLTPLPQSAAVAMWDTEDACVDRLCKLRDRQVLDAAGFLLHDADEDLSALL